MGDFCSMATYVSPLLNDTILPTDGIAINQPAEATVVGTYTSPVISDHDLSLFDKESKILSSGDPNQTITSNFLFGDWLTIDTVNKRIIINDGRTDRILIGRY